MRDAIHQVLLGCPQLESLELVACVGYDVLSIYSTTLKRLVIVDTSILSEYIDKEDLEISAPNVESICMSGDLHMKCMLTNLSSLLQATLYFCGSFYRIEDVSQEQANLLESLVHVENLKLEEWCNKILSIREKKGLP
ncbi:hypothetical protein LIER_28109 [Lithospermum erythrorhizon]|uniref:Uncharacterized protein n=1 Tax=Lithospermum erythrorhizon TaxID=34254 RepID=A0AAV3RG53_LITER